MELPNLRTIRITLIPVLLILVLPFFLFTPLFQQKNLLEALNETVSAVRAVVEASRSNGTQHGT